MFGLVVFNVAVVQAPKLASPSLIGAVLGATPVVLAVVGAVSDKLHPSHGCSLRPTALAFALWYSGLHLLGADRAGVYAGLIPVGALVVSVLLAQEPLQSSSAAGCALVGGAIWFAVRAPDATQRPPSQQ